MHIKEWLSQEHKNQSDLARIIKRDRVRAHRIYHGSKPNDEEMNLIYEASKGLVTGNDFYKLKPKTRAAFKQSTQTVNPV